MLDNTKVPFGYISIMPRARAGRIIERYKYREVKHPFISITSGPTGSGKSIFCIMLLQNLKSLCTKQEFNGGIFWCFGERSAVPDRELSELNKTIRVHKGVPENFETRTANLVSYS